jgi:hypothetical protein
VTGKNGKIGKGKNEWIQSFLDESFFLYTKKRKTERIKSSNLRNFINVTQHIPTVFVFIVYHTLSIIYTKVTVYKIYSSVFFPFYHLLALPNLPVNYNLFTILPVNLKPGKSSTLLTTPLSVRITNFFPIFAETVSMKPSLALRKHFSRVQNKNLSVQNLSTDRKKKNFDKKKLFTDKLFGGEFHENSFQHFFFLEKVLLAAFQTRN